MGKTAFIFPGQGAQKAGMGKDFYEKYDTAKEVFDSALRKTISLISPSTHRLRWSPPALPWKKWWRKWVFIRM